MKKNFLSIKMLLGLVVLGLAVPVISNAVSLKPGGLFVEPSVTYERGETTVNYGSPLTTSEGDADGFGIGARVGIHILESIFLGIDGRYSMPRFEDPATNFSARATSANWGPVAGVQMPIVGLRVWASAIFGGKFDPKEDSGIDLNYKDTSGYRVGVGTRVMVTSVNLEFQQLKYKEVEVERAGAFTGGTFSNTELQNDSWILSVSFPIEL